MYKFSVEKQSIFFLYIKVQYICSEIVPRYLRRTSKLQEKPVELLREHPARQNNTFSPFFLFLCHFCQLKSRFAFQSGFAFPIPTIQPTKIRIQIRFIYFKFALKGFSVTRIICMLRAISKTKTDFENHCLSVQNK